MSEPSLTVTTVFARVVRPGHEVNYENWLEGVTDASSDFPGYRGTTVLRPSGGRKEYVAITQFDNQQNLDKWLSSAERARWLAKLESIDICRQQVMSLVGMERWFTLPGTSTDHMPPRYKTAMLILLGLYPLVLILDIVLSPLLAGLPAPLKVLISLIVSVAIMVWIILPVLTRLFSGWLHPKPKPPDASVGAN